MPLGLFADRPGHVVLSEYTDPALGPRQYRVHTEFGSIKHGTGFLGFSGRSPFSDRTFDLKQRLFVPRQDGADAGGDGRGYVGNMFVGQVVEVGGEVKRWRVGDRVFDHGPLTQTHTLEEAQGEPLESGMSAEDAVCIDPGLFAFGAIRDGRIALGDDVVVFGLGAIGQLAVQLLRLAGCARVIAVDPVARRRELASRLGAEVVLDPQEDVALSVRQLLGRGADVAVEASGSYSALHQAMRAVGQCGRVVTVGFYKARDSQLELGAEFFHNRIELIASLPAWGNPLRDAPLWDTARMSRSLVDLFRSGRLTSRGIVEPVVNFGQSADAFMQAYRDPAYAIKLGVRFSPPRAGPP